VSTNVIEYDNTVLDIGTLLHSYSEEITEGRKEGGERERERDVDMKTNAKEITLFSIQNASGNVSIMRDVSF
jgi:hypothetical protein